MRRFPWLIAGTLIGTGIGFLMPVRWHGYDSYADFAWNPIYGSMIGCVAGLLLDLMRSLFH
jgi:F0F1-type ATP synthase assembly protein I